MSNTLQQNRMSCMKRRDVLFIMILAFVAVTVFSTSSFLYPFNRWVDANCIFTVGKSIFCGEVPYRDLMDHKGFLLYLINGVGSLISFKSFFGVYILELVSGFVFLWACYKMLLLFTGRKVLCLMPFLAVVTYGSTCFEQGATAEEFCLPILAPSFYIGLRSIVNGKMLTLREVFLLGVFASCVFWIKYTICGLYVGLGIGLCLFYIQNKWHGQLLKSIGWFCLGLVPVSAAIILYYAYNHALSDLWTVYFYDNLFNYTITPDSHGVLGKLVKNEILGLGGFISNPLMACMLIGSLVELYLRKDKKVFAFGLVCFLCMFLMLFIGRSCLYYPLPLAIMMPFSLLLALRMFKRTTSTKKYVIYSGVFLFAIAFCGLRNITKLRLMFDVNPAVLRISKLIMEGEEHSPTMIEYGMYDIGVYTLCGNVPECKHFCYLNLSLKEQADAQDDYITTCHPTYIIADKPLSFDGYECVSVQTQRLITLRHIFSEYIPSIKVLQPAETDYYIYRYKQHDLPLLENKNMH